MGLIKEFEPEKLVMGILYTDDGLYETVMNRLNDIFGPTDSSTEEYSFSDFSVYYDQEMDGSVRKRFISFQRCVSPDRLADIKILTNDLEAEYAAEGGRRVNLDPCLLSHGRFVMATTKGASFRVPLQKGIYADLSLVYSNGRWNSFFWTYGDVKSVPVEAYLTQVRRIYLEQRKNRFV